MNFILEYQAQDTAFCDELIAYHAKGEQKQGMTSGGYKPDEKKSTDVLLEDGIALHMYFAHLSEAVTAYKEQYPMCDMYSPWSVIEKINVQHYAPGEGFYGWHTERSSVRMPSAGRHLTFLTYLNDLDNGGTEFSHQNLVTKAVRGKTLVFPCDWTHTHRGQISRTQEKFIVTGWFSFLE